MGTSLCSYTGTQGSTHILRNKEVASLTTNKVVGSDTTPSSTVVCHLGRRGNILVEDDITTVIDDGTSGEHANPTLLPSAHHLTVQCYTVTNGCAVCVVCVVCVEGGLLTESLTV